MDCLELDDGRRKVCLPVTSILGVQLIRRGLGIFGPLLPQVEVITVFGRFRLPYRSRDEAEITYAELKIQMTRAGVPRSVESDE
jgi:hypothetical protein